MELRNKVSGVVHDCNVSKLTVRGLPQPEFTLYSLFGPLADVGVNVDAIAHSAEPGSGRADCAFTVSEADLGLALRVTRETAALLWRERLCTTSAASAKYRSWALACRIAWACRACLCRARRGGHTYRHGHHVAGAHHLPGARGRA